MFRKNVAGQVIHFQGVDSATGGIKSGVTWTVRRCIDGTFAAGGGTVTEDGSTGWYKYAMSQADTNGNNIGFNFTGTGAIPQTVNIITTAADPTDVVRLGLTALPNADAEAAGGLYTRGAGAGQINQPANGQIDTNVVKLAGTAQTAGDIIADTNDIQARLPAALVSGRMDSSVGAMAANVLTATAINDDAINDAKVASDVTIASVTGAVGSVTAGVTVTTNNDKTGYGLSSAAIQAIWDALTSALTTVGSVGKRIADFLTGDAYARLGAPAGASISADIAAVKSDTGAIKTKTDNLPTDPADASDIAAAFGTVNSSLTTIAGHIDTEIADIKAKTDNLPASPAAVGSPMTLEDDAITAAKVATDAVTEIQSGLSTLDAAGVRTAVGLATANLDTQLTGISDKTDNLPADPAATSDIPSSIPTADEIADAVWDVPFPATPILDGFNRTDEGPPPSSNWGTGIGISLETPVGHQVVSNAVRREAGSTSESESYWSAEQFGPDSQFYITVTTLGVSSLAVGARLNNLGPATLNGYYALVQNLDEIRIYKVVNGLHTILAEEVALLSISIGSKWGISVIGSTIRFWRDAGSGWHWILQTQDSTHTEMGNVGFYAEMGGTSALDDAGGGTVPSVFLRRASSIADSVWDEDIVSEHQTADSAGEKLSQALVLYDGD